VECLHYCREKLEDAEDALEDARIADAVEEGRSFGHGGQKLGMWKVQKLLLDNL
jgi:hypothetical protein